MSAPFFASVGLGNFVCTNRVIAVITPKSKTARNYMRVARKAGTFMDVCMGKSMKSVVLFDNGYVLVSHISTTTLRFRFSNLHKPRPWQSGEKRREEEFGEDDVLDLLDDEEEDDEEDDDEVDEEEQREDEKYGLDDPVDRFIDDEEEDPPIELP